MQKAIPTAAAPTSPEAGHWILVVDDEPAMRMLLETILESQGWRVRVANGAVMNALADGVAVGNIDAAKVDAAVAGVSATAGQIPAATADALNQTNGG